jgi:hypothetical protein
VRICFVDPKGMHFGLNTGIGYLVSSLREAGFGGIKVFDFNNNGNDAGARVEEIRGYDAIGFSIKSFTRDAALAIARQVKTDRNVLFAGGPHISLDGANFLREAPEFAAGFAGEGERPVVSWLRAIGEGGDPASAKGVILRRGGNWWTPGRPRGSWTSTPCRSPTTAPSTASRTAASTTTRWSPAAAAPTSASTAASGG